MELWKTDVFLQQCRILFCLIINLIQILALRSTSKPNSSLTSCVTSNKFLNLHMPQFPYVKYGATCFTIHSGIWRLKLIYLNLLAQCLPRGKCYKNLLSSLIFLLSLFQIFFNNNHVVSWRKSEYWSHVNPLGLLRISRCSGALFLAFLTTYTVTLVGNLSMIMIIRISPKLNIPIYFFLSHLSFVDFCYSIIVTLKLLEKLVVEDRTISFIGCIMQFFLACVFVVAENMLAVVAYDWFVAICNLLFYTGIMSPKCCASLVAGPYILGIVSFLTLTYFLLALSFHGSNIINNFVCECWVIISVSCSEPYISKVLCFVIAIFSEVSR